MNNFISSLIISIKRLFRYSKQQYYVYDTSYISRCFGRFVKEVEKGNAKHVVTEGVAHELSAGRREHEICRKAYSYINGSNSPENLEVAVTPDSMHSWPVDDQVVAIAYEYFKKGYNVTLVTCDVDMANKAKYRGLKFELVPGSRNVKSEIPNEEIRKKSQFNIASVENKELLRVPCVVKGKTTYINVGQNVAVYDSKGKRRIGKERLIPVIITDTLNYKGVYYKILSLTDNCIHLRKV